MGKNESISLINSDCLTALKDIPSQYVDLILTDPPYNLGLFMQNRDTNLKKMRDNFFGAADWDNLDYDSWKVSLEIFFKQAARIGMEQALRAVYNSETYQRLCDQKTGLYFQNYLYVYDYTGKCNECKLQKTMEIPYRPGHEQKRPHKTGKNHKQHRSQNGQKRRCFNGKPAENLYSS